MIDTEDRDYHTRIGASCYDCENSRTCRMSADIYDTEKIVTNFAASGCIHYCGTWLSSRSRRGGYRRGDRETNSKIRDYLLNNPEPKMSGLREISNRARIHNVIFSLKKRGYKIDKAKINDDIIFKITYNGKKKSTKKERAT